MPPFFTEYTLLRTIPDRLRNDAHHHLPSSATSSPFTASRTSCMALARPLKNRIGDTASIKLHRFGRIVISRNDVSQSFWRMIGIDYTDNSNAESGSFGNSAPCDNRRQRRKAPSGRPFISLIPPMDFCSLATSRWNIRTLFFRSSCRQYRLRWQPSISFKRLMEVRDRFEIGQHPSQPALVDIRHTGTLWLRWR